MDERLFALRHHHTALVVSCTVTELCARAIGVAISVSSWFMNCEEQNARLLWVLVLIRPPTHICTPIQMHAMPIPHGTPHMCHIMVKQSALVCMTVQSETIPEIGRCLNGLIYTHLACPIRRVCRRHRSKQRSADTCLGCLSSPSSPASASASSSISYCFWGCVLFYMRTGWTHLMKSRPRRGELECVHYHDRKEYGWCGATAIFRAWFEQ